MDNALHSLEKDTENIRLNKAAFSQQNIIPLIFVCVRAHACMCVVQNISPGQSSHGGGKMRRIFNNMKLCSDKSKFWFTTSQHGKQTMTVNSIFQNAKRKDFDLVRK